MKNYGNHMKLMGTSSYYHIPGESSAASRQKLSRSYLTTKRMLDIVASAVGILFLMPLLMVITLLLKLENPRGPVFFRQTRVGKDGRAFTMYKFRSMVVNAEQILDKLLDSNEVSGAMFKMKDDPRITKVGKFIRKTSLDELPQLWNVLKGDMSLVGPRPSLPREVEQYTYYDKQRLTVTPGCTGYWQIGGRNSLSFAEMVELDLQYIRERSFWTDIKVILKTVKVMLFPKDAY